MELGSWGVIIFPKKIFDIGTNKDSGKHQLLLNTITMLEPILNLKKSGRQEENLGKYKSMESNQIWGNYIESGYIIYVYNSIIT